MGVKNVTLLEIVPFADLGLPKRALIPATVLQRNASTYQPKHVSLQTFHFAPHVIVPISVLSAGQPSSL